MPGLSIKRPLVKGKYMGKEISGSTQGKGVLG